MENFWRLQSKNLVDISKKGRAVAILLSMEAFKQMQDKAEKRSEPPNIDGILRWIEQHPSDGEAINEADYEHHLEEKYT